MTPYCWNISNQLYLLLTGGCLVVALLRILSQGLKEMNEKWYIIKYVIEKRRTTAETTMHLKKNMTFKVACGQCDSVLHVTCVPRKAPCRSRPLGTPHAGEGGWMWVQWKSLAQSPKPSRGQEGYFRGTQGFLYFLSNKTNWTRIHHSDSCHTSKSQWILKLRAHWQHWGLFILAGHLRPCL